MWTLIATAALAGTISVTSEDPIGVSIDGNVAANGTREVSVDGLDPGLHVVQATNLSGNPIDTYEVNLSGEDDRVDLVFVNRRLQRVLDAGSPDLLIDYGPKPIGEAQYADLLTKLVKGSSKRKFRKLEPYVGKYWFTIRQVQNIAYSWEKIGDRALAARMLATKCVDPENAAAMDALFPSIELRKQVHTAYGIP
jgi:hypothetical protein